VSAAINLRNQDATGPKNGGPDSEYNTVRPHRGLGMMTPAAYAAKVRRANGAGDESPCEGRLQDLA
jgi:hypothetical protein